VTPPWPAATFTDPRFAAIGDLMMPWPAGQVPSVGELNVALHARLAPHALRLFEAPPQPRRRRTPPRARSIYEVRVADTGEIPTRPYNLHDVFNALSWAAFPKAKLALTHRIVALQGEGLKRGELPARRSREHDRLALLDEGGLISLQASDGARGVIVGHAIWQHAAVGELTVRAAEVRLEAPALCWATATADQVRAAVDTAWRDLVRMPARLHAAMADRAGVEIDEHSLWQPARR
jgi:hypothetical protein